jgi:Holliday junction resolvase RusA-like endonuclease
MTPAGKALKEQIQWEAKAQWKRKPLVGHVAVSITLYFGTKRKADWDNFHKLSCDALSGIAYGDDSQIKRAVVAVGYDKQRPRIEIAVEPLG